MREKRLRGKDKWVVQEKEGSLREEKWRKTQKTSTHFFGLLAESGVITDLSRIVSSYSRLFHEYKWHR